VIDVFSVEELHLLLGGTHEEEARSVKELRMVSMIAIFHRAGNQDLQME
jgi:hypothetical protein